MGELAPFQRVSVVIPAYNAEAVIENTLASVRAQTLPAYEIIVVDDGSRDRTADVVRSHDGVTLIQQANAGVSAARNCAIRAASGTWVALLDADDDWLPDKNLRQLALLEAHDEIVWSACNAHYVLASGERRAAMPPDIALRLRQGIVPYFESVVAGVPYVTSGLVIRRDILDRVGAFDLGLHGPEDRDLFWRVAASFPQIAYVGDISCAYHLDTPNSITKGSRERSQSLRMVCSNIRRDKAGGQVDPAMLRYGRALALFNYLARFAAGEIMLSNEAAAEARALIEPTVGERLLLAGLQILPDPVSRRLVRLVQPKFH